MKEQLIDTRTDKKYVSAFYTGLAAIALSVFYPTILGTFSGVVKLYGSADSISSRMLLVITAVILMALTFLIPVLASWSIQKINREQQWKYPKEMRRILHFIFAVSPFYTITVLAMFKSGTGQWHSHLWYLLTGIAALLFIYYSKRTSFPVSISREKPLARSWRLVHGISALSIIIGFVIIHLLNHMLALWSTEWHSGALEVFRKWYRADFVEPLVLGIFLILLISGVRMVWHYTQSSSNFFRLLQTCSGFYLAVFLCSHIVAVFLTRQEGVDTDWVFATGPNGLLHGFVMLFPYYTLASFLILLHASLGMRQLLLDKSWNPNVVNRIFYGLTLVSFFVSLVISTATMGVELRKEHGAKSSQTIEPNLLIDLINKGMLVVNPRFESHLPGIEDDYSLKVLEVKLAPLIAEPLHTHPGVELLYCLEGQGQVEIDGEIHSFNTGNLIKVNRDQKKSLINLGEADSLKVLAFMILEDDFPTLSLCN